METVFRKDVLRDRVALVTGGGSGICKGITEALMRHGARSAIIGRNAERLENAATELEQSTGAACLPVAADVREPAAIESAIAKTLERFGRLDVVVNGAAGNFLAPASQLSYNGFRTVLEIDTMGTYNVCRASFDGFFKDNGGTVINISATLHYGATPLQTHASAAKAAIDSVTRSLALEWGALGVRVNGIAPGPIGDTEGVARLVPHDVKARMEERIPIGRFGRIDEVASIALFLASDGSSLINGATIVADGGAWLSGRALALS
jgi:peroxisomal 2,4-dienoyl-CoA reductase